MPNDREIIVLLLCALGLFLLSIPPAKGAEFKPLTRAEPIVRMVLQESNGEPFYGQVAVAGTVFDRMEDPRWPDTAKGVVYQPWQYTGMRHRLGLYSRANITKARTAVALSRRGVRPCGRVFWYHNPTVQPSWSYVYHKHCTIGLHTFYGDH